jgi:hypothetical protein
MRIRINLKQNGTLLGRNKKMYEYEKNDIRTDEPRELTFGIFASGLRVLVMRTVEKKYEGKRGLLIS